MRKQILITLLVSLILCEASHAELISGKSQEAKREQRKQYVSRAEVEAWAKDMQHWFDFDSDVELLRKVASRSEAHGYVREEEGGG